MKYSFFLLPIVMMGFVPFAFADYRGENYLDIDNGGSHTWTGGLSPWVDTGQIENGKKVFAHYIIDNQLTYVKVQNGEASFVFDKTTCSAKIYTGGLIGDSNDFILGSDSYVPKSSVNGSGTWSIVTSVNNASCVTEIIETETSIEISGTKESSAGIFKIRYLKEEGQPLKTILEATNLTALTDRRFGVTQTQSIPQIISWAGQQRDLADYVGQTFDRTWLEDNKRSLSNLLVYGNLKFDVIDAWDNLESISVNSVSDEMASISFNYLRNTPILLPNEKLIIDPTYSTNDPVEDGYIVDTGNNNNLDGDTLGFISTTATVNFVGRNDGADPEDGSRSYYEFPIVDIPDNAIVLNVVFILENGAPNGTPDGCDYMEMALQPSVSTTQQKWDDISDGTVFVNDDPTCNTAGATHTIDLGTNADVDVMAQLTSDWFAIGIKSDVEGALDGSYHLSRFFGEENTGTPDPTLEITYVLPEPLKFEVEDLTIENVGDALRINGSLSIIAGSPSANVTSIIYSINGTTINTNSTGQNFTRLSGQNFTSIPSSLNFGPFWYQQTTDSAYNHTVTVTIQDYLYDIYTNYTFSLVTREYDPDYFTALDPSQGLVNYTFPEGNDIINVNRDTGGSLFNVECRYFTQAQAFFNELTQGTWDNQSNILFYVGDTSGYYYIQCYNDGELFVTGISQNYSNALVPGLIIFDQLGGFFGAPSIILVIISILSLGTGRNYPIILLIAASVTGILLALELLVLDPGLVVAIIVMTGIGLFGIRKFY